MPEAARQPAGLFSGYAPLADAYDEFFEAPDVARPDIAPIVERLDSLGRREFKARQKLADEAFFQSGVTFAVYADNRGSEKIFPFDMIPRLIPQRVWTRLRSGLEQRVRALNHFLADVYGQQRILAENVIPRFLIEGAKGFLPQMRNIRPRGDVYVHVAGVDLIRDPRGEFLVLEDNLRCPSGVSYVIENRLAMKRVFPRIFAETSVEGVEEYPMRLREALASLAPEGEGDRPCAVVLTPGSFNSAYFEHSFLARRMGCDLVEGQDLFVDEDRVYARTTRGPKRVDVIYRRIDDQFLDPHVFRADSLLGVPGIVGAYAKGNVALANALGNGVADDKGVYPFVPDMIRFYLGEEPLLGQVDTYVCAREDDCRYVLEHLHELVVKSVNEAGGYGMLMGPQSTRKEREEFEAKIRSDPRNFIAQPRVELSTCPTWFNKGVQPRRVDLRPYIVTGSDTWVMPGGLTRVALVEGSYVVNSSQGGGSKDTWILGGSADDGRRLERPGA